MAFNSLKRIFQAMQHLPVIERSIRVTSEVLKLEKVEQKELPLIEQLKLVDVSFFYMYQKQVIKNVTYAFKMNEKYLVSGVNGCGKSSLLKLLSNYYQEYEGNLYLNDINYKSLNEHDLTPTIDLITTENHLFFSDFYDFFEVEEFNTILFRLIERFELNDFFDHLSNGIYTKFDEYELKTSKGEKQKLITIKMLISNSKVLLIDEIDSNLDEKTRLVLNESLTELTDRLIIFVSHKPLEYDFYDRHIKLVRGEFDV
jgi:ABC-type bacteriocin/lantibiotic exporter with double-glycine peptidase domain